jgi:branched-chain amino acid transport system permease protein
MPSLGVLWPFIVQGLALGAIYAVTGTGLVVLYRTTGVVNLAFGAIGAFGAHIAFTLMGGSASNSSPIAHGWRVLAYPVTVLVCGFVTLLYGVWIAPRLARRDPLAKALGMAGVALFVLGVIRWRWDASKAKRMNLPTKTWKVGGAIVTSTQIAALVFALAVVIGVSAYLKRSATGTAMRAIANDRSVAGLLGVPVRRVEALAWLGSGVLCGCVFVMLPVMFQTLDPSTMTWFIIGALAGAIVGQFRSLWTTFIASLAIGVVEAGLAPFHNPLNFVSRYRQMTPFVVAAFALLWISRRRTVVLAGREMN